MADSAQQYFQYAGNSYQLAVELISGDGTITHTLDNNSLETIEFDSEFNKLVSTGSFIYNDGYGHFNRFFEKQECYIQLMFCRVEQEGDGNVIIYRQMSDQKIMHGFLIQNIEILKREDTYIKYRVTFQSMNTYNCLATVDYSNYGMGRESVFDILRACFEQVDLHVDEQSFRDIQTDVKLNYITNGNDNIFTIFKYLFNRLYQSGKKDKSLKFLLWDIFQKKYRLFDISNGLVMKDRDKLLLSMMKSDKETMVEPERVQLGSVTQFTSQDFIKSVFNVNVDQYDYYSDYFSKEIIPQRKMTAFLNNHIGGDPSLIDKAQEYNSMPYRIYPFRRGSEWNNDFNFYGEFIKNMSKNNALLVDMSGMVLRSPGYVMDVQIDRENTDIDNESIKQTEDYLQRFRGFEGPWIIYRVRNVIEFKKHRYRQFVTLMRNFTIDMIKVK